MPCHCWETGHGVSWARIANSGVRWQTHGKDNLKPLSQASREIPGTDVPTTWMSSGGHIDDIPRLELHKASSDNRTCRYELQAGCSKRFNILPFRSLFCSRFKVLAAYSAYLCLLPVPVTRGYTMASLRLGRCAQSPTSYKGRKHDGAFQVAYVCTLDWSRTMRLWPTCSKCVVYSGHRH